MTITIEMQFVGGPSPTFQWRRVGYGWKDISEEFNEPEPETGSVTFEFVRYGSTSIDYSIPGVGTGTLPTSSGPQVVVGVGDSNSIEATASGTQKTGYYGHKTDAPWSKLGDYHSPDAEPPQHQHQHHEQHQQHHHQHQHQRIAEADECESLSDQGPPARQEP